MKLNHAKYMKAALAEAKKGLREGGIPIGAVLVKDGQNHRPRAQPPRTKKIRHTARRDGLSGKRRTAESQRLQGMCDIFHAFPLRHVHRARYCSTKSRQ